MCFINIPCFALTVFIVGFLFLVSLLMCCPVTDQQEDQAELLEAAGLDPEALAALPPEMRREVLEQVSRLSSKL